jgi:hypothetical protein
MLDTGNLTAHLLAFQVFVRQGRVLLALKSLLHAQKLCPGHPKVHSAMYQFWHMFATVWKPTENISPTVVELVLGYRDRFGLDVEKAIDESSLAQLNKLYLSDAMLQGKAGNVLSALELGVKYEAMPKTAVQQHVEKMLSEPQFRPRMNVDNTVGLGYKQVSALYQWAYKTFPGEGAWLEELRGRLHLLYPLAALFLSEPDRIAQRLSRVNVDDELKEGDSGVFI